MHGSRLRCLVSFGAASLVVGALAASRAEAQQTVDFYIGGFVPPSANSRPSDDVVFQDLGNFTFDPHGLNGLTLGGDWIVPIGRLLDASLGVGWYSRTVPSFYTNLVNPDGSNITQDLALRIVPISATVRVVPFGRTAPLQPYVGAGVAIEIWRYAESGTFLDQNNVPFRSSYSGTGSVAAPEVLGGIRIPVGPSMGLGFEIRWQGGSGTLPTNQGFAGPKIDLSGVNYLATFGLRF